jgi:hypothetical protein
MKSFWIGFLLLSALTSYLHAERLPDFELRDQFGNLRAYRFPKSRVTVMTLADQRGSEQLEAWISQIFQRFGRKIDIDGIADLSSVPSPLRGAVRALFRSQLNYLVLMDWDGRVVKRFAPQKGIANIYVINRDGRIVCRAAGPIDSVAFADVYRSIDRTIGEL